MKNREARREIEAELSVGMQAGEECGFHGNWGGELWVSVPAPHCTGPCLSTALLSLSSLPHRIFLNSPPPETHTHTHNPLVSPPFPCLTSLPQCDSGRIKHAHNLCRHWILMQALSSMHTEPMCLPPAPPLFFHPFNSPDLHAYSPPAPPPLPTHCTRSGRS